MGDNSDDPARSEDGSVVDPEELDIEDDDHVKALGDNRYVVSPGDPIADSTDRLATDDSTAEGSDHPTGSDDSGSSAAESESGTGQGGGGAGRSDDTRERQDRTDAFTGDAVDVHRARAHLTERMVDAKGAYGFDVTAQFGDNVVQQHLQANDIVTVFDALLLWYAEHLDDETPAEEAIGLLLAESDIPVEYPANSLIELVKEHGLDGGDTIADLVDAACEDTVQFPPQ